MSMHYMFDHCERRKPQTWQLKSGMFIVAARKNLQKKQQFWPFTASKSIFSRQLWDDNPIYHHLI